MIDSSQYRPMALGLTLLGGLLAGTGMSSLFVTEGGGLVDLILDLLSAEDGELSTLVSGILVLVGLTDAAFGLFWLRIIKKNTQDKGPVDRND
jgi:hypothetical protein